ncbi:MAG: hypothetical protein ACXAEN_18480 [Candidatus Thorarchaeota archaeon]|jgi:hypothetical protein
MKQKDDLAINIRGRIKPRLLFGATFEITICKCENGGYYIKHFPESLLKYVDIEITDFKEGWRKTYPDTQDITAVPTSKMTFPEVMKGKIDAIEPIE